MCCLSGHLGKHKFVPKLEDSNKMRRSQTLLLMYPLTELQPHYSLHQLANYATKKAAAKAIPASTSSDGSLNKLLKLLEPQEKPKLSPEDAREAKQRTVEYSKLMMREHREWQKDMTTKIKLKLAAIEALPSGHLKEAARIEDLSLPPPNRVMWTDTPPIDTSKTSVDDVKVDQKKKRLGTKKRAN